jgi:hypothetical protein
MTFEVHVVRMSGEMLTVSADSSWLVIDLHDKVEQMLFPQGAGLTSQPFGLFTIAGDMLLERQPLDRTLCEPFLTLVVDRSLFWRKHWRAMTPIWLQKATRFVMEKRDFLMLANEGCLVRFEHQDSIGDAGLWGWWSKVKPAPDKLYSPCKSCNGVGKLRCFWLVGNGVRCCDACRGTGLCFLNQDLIRRQLRTPCRQPCTWQFCSYCRNPWRSHDTEGDTDWQIDRRGSRKSLPVRQQLQMMFSQLQDQSIEQSNLVVEPHDIEKLIWLRRKRREELFTNLDSLGASSQKQAYLLRKAVHKVNLQIRRNRKRKTDKGVRRKTQRWGRGKAGKGWTNDDLEMEFHSGRHAADEAGKQIHSVGFELRLSETRLKNAPHHKFGSTLDRDEDNFGYGMHMESTSSYSRKAFKNCRSGKYREWSNGDLFVRPRG